MLCYLHLRKPGRWIGEEGRELCEGGGKKRKSHKPTSSSTCVWQRRSSASRLLVLWSQGEEKMDITDQGAQMEPLLPTVRPDSRAAVAFMCKYVSSFQICTDMKKVRFSALYDLFLILNQAIWGETSRQCTIWLHVPWISRQTWMLRTLNWQTDTAAANISVSSLLGLCTLKWCAFPALDTFFIQFIIQNCSHGAAGLTWQRHVRRPWRGHAQQALLQ